jgi:Phage protein (N4 Gp49/phage Sf6 gene 66) family
MPDQQPNPNQFAGQPAQFSPQPMQPGFDEGSLRAREVAVQAREDRLNAIMAKRRELTSTNLTEKDVETQIVSEFSISAFDAFSKQPNVTDVAERALRCTTICVLILRNGFPIVGSSSCAAPENYDHTTGLAEAKADAMVKLWLCEEYSLRNRLMGLEVIDDPAALLPAPGDNRVPRADFSPVPGTPEYDANRQFNINGDRVARDPGLPH